MRLGSWKQTHTNRAVYPLDPRAEDVSLDDIAHALAQEVRYAGHAPFPYSVAQHSVYVSLRVETLAHNRGDDAAMARELAKAALLHDAHEAYLKDQPSPLKAHLVLVAPNAMGHRVESSFKELERHWDRAIAEALEVAVPFNHPLIKHADMELLATEAAQFFPEDKRPRPWGVMPEPLLGLIPELPWRHARDSFLFRWQELGGHT